MTYSNNYIATIKCIQIKFETKFVSIENKHIHTNPVKMKDIDNVSFHSVPNYQTKHETVSVLAMD